MGEAKPDRSTTGDDDTSGLRVYIPPPLWRALLESLKAASLKWPADMSAVEDAQRAVTDFLLAIPAVRDSGIVAPLLGLLAALPDLLRLSARFNQLTEELIEAVADPDATRLAKGVTQLSMFVRFYEDATRGKADATPVRPAGELFEAMHDRAQGGRPAMIWDAASKPSRNRAHHITRAHLAAAVDWLVAANIPDKVRREWWGRDTEYDRAHKWREQCMDGSASPLTIALFEDLQPPNRQSVTEPEAKAKAAELRGIARGRKTDA